MAGIPRSTGSRPTLGANLTWLDPGVVGGTEEYAVRLLEAVAPALPDFEFRVYARSAVAAAHPELAGRVSFVTMPTSASPRGFGRSKPVRVGLEQTWLAWAARGDRFVHHFGGTVPLVRSRPAVVTIHDLQPLDMPHHFGPVKRRWLGAMIPHAVRWARVVTTPSRHTADALIARFDVDPQRVRVVPHSLDPRLAPVKSNPDTSVPVQSNPDTSVPGMGRALPGKDRVRLGRYLLYPAIAYPHKRHRDLLAVLDRLSDRHPDLALVFTGRPGPETPRLRAEAAELGLDDRVLFTGRIPAEDLKTLYRHAASTVFPSAYEGFGNPALEAMAIGCPLVVSDAGALPEVVGDAAPVVPVGDVDALAASVTRILDDPGYASDLSQRGRARSRNFDVAIATSALVDVYLEMLERDD